MDPDPYSEYGPGSTEFLNTDPIWIRIHRSGTVLAYPILSPGRLKPDEEPIPRAASRRTAAESCRRRCQSPQQKRTRPDMPILGSAQQFCLVLSLFAAVPFLVHTLSVYSLCDLGLIIHYVWLWQVLFCLFISRFA